MTDFGQGPHVGASYDPETDTYRASYRPNARGSLVGAINHLVSVATEKESETMPPLYAVVDTDALGELFRAKSGGPAVATFQYCGCAVTAMSDGAVVVSPLEDV